MMVNKWLLVLLAFLVVGLIDDSKSIHIPQVPQLSPSQNPACKALAESATVPSNQVTKAPIPTTEEPHYCQLHIIYWGDANTNLLNDTYPCLCVDSCIVARLNRLKLATTPQQYSEANYNQFRCVNSCFKLAEQTQNKRPTEGLPPPSTTSSPVYRQDVPEEFNEKSFIDHLLRSFTKDKPFQKLVNKLKDVYEADQKTNTWLNFVQFCEPSGFFHGNPPQVMGDACFKQAALAENHQMLSDVVSDIIACRYYMRCLVARVKDILMAKQCCLTGRPIEDHMKHFICARDTYNGVKQLLAN